MIEIDCKHMEDPSAESRRMYKYSRRFTGDKVGRECVRRLMLIMGGCLSAEKNYSSKYNPLSPERARHKQTKSDSLCWYQLYFNATRIYVLFRRKGFFPQKILALELSTILDTDWILSQASGTNTTYLWVPWDYKYRSRLNVYFRWEDQVPETANATIGMDSKRR